MRLKIVSYLHVRLKDHDDKEKIRRTVKLQVLPPGIFRHL